MSWHNGPFCGFDTETTGVDPETARIVTAAVVICETGKDTVTKEWLTDVGGETIPDGAARIHGITTEIAHAKGQQIGDVVQQITDVLIAQIRAGVPLVIMNAPYDLTLFDRELGRLGLPPLEVIAGTPLIVLDPKVMDKEADKWRGGKRTLTHLAEHYQVALDRAHSAAADALAAVRVVWRIGQLSENGRSHTAAALHDYQVRWAAEQAADLEAHFRRNGRPNEVVNRDWPLIPRQQDGAQ